MKFLIFIPFFIFSQTPDYPDSLYLKSGQIYPCEISKIEESNIIFKYGGGRETTLFLIGVDKIVLNRIGVIYTKESGFIKKLLDLQNIIEQGKNKNSFQGSGIDANSLIDHENNLYLILSNGDAISKFSTQRLVGDSLVISHMGKTKLITIESITAMKKIAKSEFWESAGIGFFAGAATGLLIFAATYEKPKSSGWDGNFNVGPPPEVVAGVLGGLAGFLVGGSIGSHSDKDEIYDLSHMKPERKLKKIRLLISKQK